jgi:hypothetical protein
MFMKKITALLPICAIAILLHTCTEENNPLVNDPLLDPITNQWFNNTDSSHTFSFVTHDSLVSKGVFNGNEDHPQIGNSELYGFFDRTYVEFDVLRPEGRLKFKGNFINSNRMNLQSSEGNITLIRF